MLDEIAHSRELFMTSNEAAIILAQKAGEFAAYARDNQSELPGRGSQSITLRNKFHEMERYMDCIYSGPVQDAKP